MTAVRVGRSCRRLLCESEPDVVAVYFQTLLLPAALLFPRTNCGLVLLIRGRMDFDRKGFPFGIMGALNRRLGLAVSAPAVTGEFTGSELKKFVGSPEEERLGLPERVFPG